MINEKELTDRLCGLLREYKVAGMSVAVTNKNEVIYNKGFGFENALRPHVPTHIDATYKIASITKTFVAITALRLMEEGIISLDKPIKEYLPSLRLKRQDAENAITLRHLLMHVAGMPADGFLEEGSRDEDTAYGVILDSVRKFEIEHLPEEAYYRYSTWGYNLIGCVLEKVTGKKVSQLLDEYILTPLGTRQTTLDYFVASTYPLSLPHMTDKDGKPSVIHYQRINTVHNAGGGLYSNADDLCRLARFLLRGGVTDSGERLLSKASFLDMTARHIERSDVLGSYYGLGIVSHPMNNTFVIGHLGNYTPYNASVLADLERGLGVAVLINSSAAELRLIIPELIFKLFS